MTKRNERSGADSWLAEEVSASQEEPRCTSSSRYDCPYRLVLNRQPHRKCVSVSSPDTAAWPRHQTLRRSSAAGPVHVVVDTTEEDSRCSGVDTTGGGHRGGTVRGEGRGIAGTTIASRDHLVSRETAQCLPAVCRHNMECHPTAALLLLLLLLLRTANAEDFPSPS